MIAVASGNRKQIEQGTPVGVRDGTGGPGETHLAAASILANGVGLAGVCGPYPTLIGPT